MKTRVHRPYTLSAKHRGEIVRYLEGSITMVEAAQAVGSTKQNFPFIVNAIMRKLVRQGDIDIKTLIKKY